MKQRIKEAIEDLDETAGMVEDSYRSAGFGYTNKIPRKEYDKLIVGVLNESEQYHDLPRKEKKQAKNEYLKKSEIWFKGPQHIK